MPGSLKETQEFLNDFIKRQSNLSEDDRKPILAKLNAKELGGLNHITAKYGGTEQQTKDAYKKMANLQNQSDGEWKGILQVCELLPAQEQLLLDKAKQAEQTLTGFNARSNRDTAREMTEIQRVTKAQLSEMGDTMAAVSRQQAEDIVGALGIWADKKTPIQEALNELYDHVPGLGQGMALSKLNLFTDGDLSKALKDRDISEYLVQNLMRHAGIKDAKSVAQNCKGLLTGPDPTESSPGNPSPPDPGIRRQKTEADITEDVIKI